MRLLVVRGGSRGPQRLRPPERYLGRVPGRAVLRADARVRSGTEDERLSQRFTILSGCSGGGKSTLLAELARRGHATVEEPGRRIVAEERARNSEARLPWIDPVAFSRRAVDIALADRREAAGKPGRVFFDRGLVDAAAALAHFSEQPLDEGLLAAHRYADRVFLTPPWPEIYASDDERRHDLAEAIAKYERLVRVYGAMGYEGVAVPKASVAERADFVMRML